MASRGIPLWLWLVGGVLGLGGAAFGFTWWRVGHPPQAMQALPDGLIDAQSSRGRALLANADAMADHLGILRWYVPQDKLSWCGVASATIALNVLQLNEPGPALRQQTLFDRPTRRIKTRLGATFGGLTLDELSGILQAHRAVTTVHFASDDTVERFRTLAAANLADPSDVLIVNYDRRSLGQTGGGHISPVAAWDRETDRVLIADTASYRYPWTWVRVPDLFAAMATPDATSGKSRGFVAVRR